MARPRSHTFLKRRESRRPRSDPGSQEPVFRNRVCLSVQRSHENTCDRCCSKGSGEEGSFMLVILLFLVIPFQVEKVRLLDRVSPRRSKVGTLYLTATHTIFIEEADVRSETWVGTGGGPRNHAIWIANNTECVSFGTYKVCSSNNYTRSMRSLISAYCVVQRQDVSKEIK